MAESREHGISASTAARVQAFVSTLTREEAEDLERIGQEGAAPATRRSAEQIKQELPASLAAKLREFSTTLSEAERSECRSLARAVQDNEVQGFSSSLADASGTAPSGSGSGHFSETPAGEVFKSEAALFAGAFLGTLM